MKALVGKPAAGGGWGGASTLAPGEVTKLKNMLLNPRLGGGIPDQTGEFQHQLTKKFPAPAQRQAWVAEARASAIREGVSGTELAQLNAILAGIQ